MQFFQNTQLSWAVERGGEIQAAGGHSATHFTSHPHAIKSHMAKTNLQPSLSLKDKVFKKYMATWAIVQSYKMSLNRDFGEVKGQGTVQLHNYEKQGVTGGSNTWNACVSSSTLSLAYTQIWFFVLFWCISAFLFLQVRFNLESPSLSSLPNTGHTL